MGTGLSTLWAGALGPGRLNVETLGVSCAQGGSSILRKSCDLSKLGDEPSCGAFKWWSVMRYALCACVRVCVGA